MLVYKIRFTNHIDAFEGKLLCPILNQIFLNAPSQNPPARLRRSGGAPVSAPASRRIPGGTVPGTTPVVSSIFPTLGSGLANAVSGTSYASEDADLLGVDEDYTALENELAQTVANIESTQIGRASCRERVFVPV